MKSRRRHFIRRLLIIIAPIIVAFFIGQLVVGRMSDILLEKCINNLDGTLGLMLGIWGTFLGFILTSESILIAFEKGTITNEFKATRHYMTILIQYTQTCLKLLIYTVLFVIIDLLEIFSKVTVALFFICVIETFISVTGCLIVLLFLLRMSVH